MEEGEYGDKLNRVSYPSMIISIVMLFAIGGSTTGMYIANKDAYCKSVVLTCNYTYTNDGCYMIYENTTCKFDCGDKVDGYPTDDSDHYAPVSIDADCYYDEDKDCYVMECNYTEMDTVFLVGMTTGMSCIFVPFIVIAVFALSYKEKKWRHHKQGPRCKYSLPPYRGEMIRRVPWNDSSDSSSDSSDNNRSAGSDTIYEQGFDTSDSSSDSTSIDVSSSDTSDSSSDDTTDSSSDDTTDSSSDDTTNIDTEQLNPPSYTNNSSDDYDG